MHPARPRTKRRIVALFAAAALVIPLQEAVRLKQEEPFPALFFPSFGGVPDDGGTYRVDKSFVEVRDSEGRSASRPGTDITADAGVLPDSVMRLMAYTRLRADGTAEREEPYGELARNLMGQHIGRDRSDSRALIDVPEVQAWMRGRIAELFPGRSIVSARIVWRRMQFDRDTHQIASQRTLKVVQVTPR